MKISDHYNSEGYFIRSYAPGRITIAFPESPDHEATNQPDSSTSAPPKFREETLETSFILSANKLIKNWAPESINELAREHAEQLVSLQPEVIILGTGNKICFPRPDWSATFYEKGIGLEVMDTGAACRTYSILTSDSRNVVVALML